MCVYPLNYPGAWCRVSSMLLAFHILSLSLSLFLIACPYKYKFML